MNGKHKNVDLMGRRPSTIPDQEQDRGAQEAWHEDQPERLRHQVLPGRRARPWLDVGGGQLEQLNQLSPGRLDLG